MKVNITIDTEDSQLVYDILEKDSLIVKPGYQKKLSDGTIITLTKVDRRRSVGLPETIPLVLSLGTSIAVNIVSSWLYDKMIDRKATLYIERKEIQKDKGEIKNILEEIFDKNG